MTPITFLRYVLLCLVILFFLALAWWALSGAVQQIPRAETAGQKVETTVQIVCGLLTLLTLITAFWWEKHAKLTQITWSVSLVLTAGLSALVWGPPMPLIALAFSAIALLIGSVFIWALRRLKQSLTQ